MFKSSALTVVASLACCAFAARGASGPALDAGKTVIAEVDNVKLTLADFEAKKPAALFQARNTYYDAQRKAVDAFVEEFLLERQAQKEGTTVAGLLERHVNGSIAKDPSEETLRVYYEGVDTAESYEAVRDKIIEAIRLRRLARAKAKYLQSLRDQAKVAVVLDPPRAPISLKGTPLRGAPDAPVVVVEFADYECPYCQQIQPALEKLATEYRGKIAFAFKDFPLPIHQSAQKAAEAAHCAGAQGKYWEYHDALFATKQLQVPDLKAHAQALKLDTAAFSSCLDSNTSAKTVTANFEESQALGLPGTPSFFVNGRLINPNGTVSYDVLRKLVDEELRASSIRAGAPSSTSTTAAAKQ